MRLALRWVLVNAYDVYNTRNPKQLRPARCEELSVGARERDDFGYSTVSEQVSPVDPCFICDARGFGKVLIITNVLLSRSQILTNVATLKIY